VPRDENVRRIRSAVTRLSRRLRAERPADALAPTKIGVLAELWRNGRMCAGDLADQLAAATSCNPCTLPSIAFNEAAAFHRMKCRIDLLRYA